MSFAGLPNLVEAVGLEFLFNAAFDALTHAQLASFMPAFSLTDFAIELLEHVVRSVLGATHREVVGLRILGLEVLCLFTLKAISFLD